LGLGNVINPPHPTAEYSATPGDYKDLTPDKAHHHQQRQLKHPSYDSVLFLRMSQESKHHGQDDKMLSKKYVKPHPVVFVNHPSLPINKNVITQVPCTEQDQQRHDADTEFLTICHLNQFIGKYTVRKLYL
jgi:hypothetical protein